MRVAIGLLVAFIVSISRIPIGAVREPVRTAHAMVIAQQPADNAGVEILKKGGNAIDAAIAVGFALNAAMSWTSA
jgi:gamma-glutamyltranspeptidase/glutathione hydrolase